MKFLELPRLGETMEEGEVVVWIKQVGDSVKRGETIAEIQTDKIVAEMPALEDFVLEEILVQAGSSIKVGQALARIRGVNEQPSGLERNQSPQPATSNPVQNAPQPGPRPVDLPGLVRASPAARRVARELSVNLAALTGTGPRGRITTSDVRAAKPSISNPSNLGSNLEPVSAVPQALPEDLHRFTRTELAAGRATVQAKSEIPHFYVRVRADLTGFVRALEIERAKGITCTVNDGIVRAVALALNGHPRLNAKLEPEGLRLLQQAHIGVMTSTPEGLSTSVVRDAATLSLGQINARVREVRARSAAGRARNDDVNGATFCVSNLGMFGVEEFSAIILPPNVAILAVGAITDEVIANEGAFRIAKTMRLTLSADHRALDGAAAALFLQSLKQLLEQPVRLFT